MMGRRRVGRPGLVGTAARTAVIAGTATAVSGKVASNQMAKAQAAQAQAQPAPAPAAPPPPAPVAAPAPAAPPSSAEERIAQLERLAALHAQGILTDEELAAEKARILA